MVAQFTEPLSLPALLSTHHWFSRWGVVVDEGDRRLVYVGGTLIGSFGLREWMKRNAILLGLLENDRSLHIGKLCEAFGLSREGLRKMQKQLRSEGLEAVLARRPGSRGQNKVSAPRRQRLEAMFEQGLSISEATKKLGKIGRSTVGFIHKAWVERGAADAPSQVQPPLDGPSSLPLLPASSEPPMTDTAPTPAAPPLTTETSTDGPTEPSPPMGEVGSDDEVRGDDGPIGTRAPTTARSVQHLGTWLVVAMLARLGLHRHAQAAGDDRVEAQALRVALDAVAMAFAIGQKCVEGVRRLATPSAPPLLQSHLLSRVRGVRGARPAFAGVDSKPAHVVDRRGLSVGCHRRWGAMV
jgi:transposase